METKTILICALIALLVTVIVWQAMATLGRERYWHEKLRAESTERERFSRANEILRSYIDDKHVVWNHGQSPQEFLDKKNFDTNEVVLITAPDLRDLLNGAWTLYKEKTPTEDYGADVSG